MESNAILSSKFEKVVSFIQWSEIEGDYLFKFEELLNKQILIPKEQIANLLSPFKMDHQLRKCLIKLPSEIQYNLNLFFSQDLSSYQSSLNTRILCKVNSLIRTSSQQVKLICDSLIFLHFTSCNMDQYNKSIRWFEEKKLYQRLNNWKYKQICVVKQKVFTVISIIHIKYNNLKTRIQIIKTAIIERQQYIKFITDKQNQSKIRKNSLVSKSYFHLCRQKQIQHKKPILQKQNINNKQIYQNLTIYLRYKVIQGLIYDPYAKISQLKQNDKNMQQFKTQQKNVEYYYNILILIERYLRQVKQKNITNNNNGTKSIIDRFIQKLENFKNTCLTQINILDQNKYFKQTFQNHKQKIDTSLISQVRKICKQQQKQHINDLSLINKFRKSKSQSTKKQNHKSMNKNTNLKQQLNKLFFNKIQIGESKQKSKSQKAFLRDRSKSKIMAKILANTFQNAKNALRQIQFEIKTNNCDRFLLKFTDEGLQKKKIVKRKKDKICFYEKFNKNKRVVADICKNSLLQQINIVTSNIKTWNPITKIQQNKKCIIQHKTTHKDHQTAQLFGLQSNGEDSNHSEVQFIKILGGVPQMMTLKIKPKDKNYILKFYYKPFDQQQIDVQISLPKSNNIFTGRYKTIWPTIKYLLRKKMLQLYIFKQNETRFSDWRTNNFEQRNHYNVNQTKIIQLFGQIDEDQLHQISSTLGLLCKFFDLLMCSQKHLIGRKYQLCQIFNEKQQLQNNNGFDKKSSIKIPHNKFTNKIGFLKQIKQLIWLNSRKQVEIGSSIIKQRGCKLNLLYSHFENPFFIIVFYCDTENLRRTLIEQKHKLIFRVKVFSIGNFRQTSNKIIEYKQQSDENIQPTYNKQILYQQQIVLDTKQLFKYKLSYDIYMKNIKKIIDGFKIDTFLQIKIMQVCWINFNGSQDFYSPDFFRVNFSQIKQYKPARIISDGIYQIPLCFLQQNTRQNKITIYQNILQFDVDQITRTAECLSNNDQVHCTLYGHKRLATFQNKLSRKKITKTPSINQHIKSISSSLNSQNFPISKCIKYFRFKVKDKRQKQIIQINFLTPFNFNENWLVEISIINISGGQKSRIVMSAQDLYSFGLSNLQKQQNILQQLCQFTKHFVIDKSSLIPKIIIVTKKNSMIDTSIDGAYRKNTIDQTNQNQNRKVDCFGDKSQKSIQLCKYRSIYLSKRYKQRKTQTNNIQTNGSLSEPKTAVFSFSNLRRRRQSNQSLLNRIEKERRTSTRTVFNDPLESSLQSIKHYLTSVREYEWYLCTIPVKFPIGQRLRQVLNCSNIAQKLFCLLSLKYINIFSENSEKHLNQGLFQIQINFSQSQYALVIQIRQQSFLQQVKKCQQKSQLSLRKCLAEIKGVKPSPKMNAKTILKQDRRYSIKTKEKKKLLKVNSLMDSQQAEMHRTERNYQNKEYNKKLSFNLFGKFTNKKEQFKTKKQDKFNLKQLLLNAVINQTFQKQKIQDEIKHQNQFTCSQCSNLGHDKFFQRYKLDLISFNLPLKMRLYHQYDEQKGCIFDVYMHSKQWKVGTGVNSGIGLGIQIQIAKINPSDHLQITKILRKQKQSIKKQDPFINNQKIDIIQSIGLKQELEIEQNSKNSDSDIQNEQISVQQIATVKILDLIRQYKLQHVEVMCQLQPELYSKNTILLTRLASYMMDIYVRGIRNMKRKQY